MFIVTFFSFTLLHIIPGDPVYAILGNDITQEQYNMAYKDLGLDKPFIQQYGSWLWKTAHGDLGNSYYYHKPIKDIIGKRIKVTLYLGIISLIISTLLGVLLGIFSAVNRGKLADNIISVLANLGTAVPIFWLGILGIYVFALKLGWLPSYGFSFPSEGAGLSFKQSILPVICLSMGSLATMTRQTRSSMLEVIHQDYIRTARSKGLKMSEVVKGHALRNALIPVVTMLGLSARNLIGGAATVETVFSITGMGQFLVQSIFGRDMVATQATVLITALFVCIVNLIVDLTYGFIDPRIRVE
jgi:peptide/nickel transport system permease protein